jgi:hypothetical protein
MAGLAVYGKRRKGNKAAALAAKQNPFGSKNKWSHFLRGGSFFVLYCYPSLNRISSGGHGLE